MLFIVVQATVDDCFLVLQDLVLHVHPLELAALLVEVSVELDLRLVDLQQRVGLVVRPEVHLPLGVKTAKDPCDHEILENQLSDQCLLTSLAPAIERADDFVALRLVTGVYVGQSLLLLVDLLFTNMQEVQPAYH